jgi:hypothetical protein
MGTTDQQKRQVRPVRRHPQPPMVVEDGPWIVGVIENPHDPSSYTLYVWGAYLLATETSLSCCFVVR